MLYTGLFTPNRESRTDEHTNTTKVQLGKPVSFLGVTYRHMDEELVTGAEMTQGRCITKACCRLGDHSQKHPRSLKAAQQIGECPFKVPQLF